jgi:hypothetical protein
LSRCFCWRVCSFWRLVKVDLPRGIHNSSLVFLLAVPARFIPRPAASRKQENYQRGSRGCRAWP